MKTSFLLPLAVLASSAVAQSTTASVNACDADYIVERCLTTETAKLDACGGQDFNCRCAAWEAILTYALSYISCFRSHLLTWMLCLTTAATTTVPTTPVNVSHPQTSPSSPFYPR